MIVVNDPDILQDDFLKLLENTKNHTLNDLIFQHNEIKSMSGDQFETLVYKNCIAASKDTQFEGHIIHTGAHAFPDIIARKFFGIEVKMTTGDKWISTGNSIMETTRIDEVERIYMFFGKFGGTIDIRFRAYQDCLYDIGVTHSPRYKINMGLADGDSIFSKMGISYEVLRNEKNPINTIKEYYRKKLKDGEELWWIDAQTEEKTVSPIIKPFRMLDKEEQVNFFVETMILFPEIFGRGQTKYERPAAYLITKYNSVSSSLRDTFTAGGQEILDINNKHVTVPKIFSHLLNHAKDIETIIEKISEEDLKYYWKVSNWEGSRINQWKYIINEQTAQQQLEITASEIYEWGLR